MRISRKSPFSGTRPRGVRRIAGLACLLALGGLSCARSVAIKPEAEEEPSPAFERITLLGLNDLHGMVLPVSASASLVPNGREVGFERGGLALLSTYAKAARARYGGSLFTLLAGNFLYGSYEAAQDKGSSTVLALNHLGVNAAVLGPRELDFGVPVLKARMSESAFPYVLSNFQDSDDPALSLWPRATRRLMLDNGRVKVGVIGLMSSHFALAGRSYLASHLSVTDLAETTVREAAALRRDGAQVIVLLAHVGLDCDSRRPKHLPPGPQGPKIFRAETPQEACLPSGELAQVLKALPPETVDAAIAGNSQRVVHHWVHGVPVIQGGSSGEYFSFIHLFFDPSLKRVRHAFTRIEGPFGVCSAVFAAQLDCNERKPVPRSGRGNLLRASFFGEEIGPDSDIARILQPVERASHRAGDTVLAQAIREVPHDPAAESALGNLVADAMRERLQTDFAVINPGAIHAILPSGNITERSLFTSVPQELSLAKLSLTGAQLRRFLTVLTSGGRGFPSVSGLRLNLIDLEYPARPRDLNGNRRIEHWEFDRLVGVKTLDGFFLKDHKKYTVATTDFLARGGDDLIWVVSTLPPSSIQIEPTLSLRDAVASRVRALGRINSLELPLIEATAPRLKPGIPPPSGGSRRRTKVRRPSGR